MRVSYTYYVHDRGTDILQITSGRILQFIFADHHLAQFISADHQIEYTNCFLSHWFFLRIKILYPANTPHILYSLLVWDNDMQCTSDKHPLIMTLFKVTIAR